ncbi:hypothetical protein [Rickettsia endosymbiont of Urophora cardui]|uniref:hypothetical protein n=1 Tax=Rickettsia endosymbiont of Urophora cardui TaxID=3066265 RepID=UPI00313BF6AB
MFRIARTVKQIFNAARNIQQVASASINSMVKYCTQSKGYIEDASDEFTFESFTKILPNQSAAKEQIKASAPIFQSVAKLGSISYYKILDSAEVRKLIYVRFADEIGARQKNDEDTKSHKINEHIETFTTYNIADEFNVLKSQGYDFAVARQAIQNQNVSKTLSERMKGLVVSGYMSNYGGESGLRAEVEKLMHKKEYVMQELSLRVSELPACEVEFDQVKQVDILGDH